METQKLKKIFKLLIFAIILLLIFLLYILPKSREGELVNKEEPGVSTDVVFQASQYDNRKMIQDYLNPTEEEKNKLVGLYGTGNFYFSGDGLHLVLPYDENGEKLITDVWPENDITRNFVKPEMDLFEVEMSKVLLKITVEDVDLKDMKNYIKSIKDEYKNEAKNDNPTMLYTAYTDDYKTVTVKFDKAKSEGVITYDF